MQGSQAFYPIVTITPPGFQVTPTMPHEDTKPKAKADYYRPRYDDYSKARRQPVIKGKEIEIQEPIVDDVAGMAFGSADLHAPGQIIFDTGATNHLTGDRVR